MGIKVTKEMVFGEFGIPANMIAAVEKYAEPMWKEFCHRNLRPIEIVISK